MGDETKTIKGSVDKVEGPITSKTGKKFNVVTINGSKFYDWQNVSKDFSEGDIVKAEVSNGEYARVLKMALIEKGEIVKQQTMDQVRPQLARGFSEPAHSLEENTLVLLNLAVELVKDEQIAVDEKVKRAKTAFFAFKDLFRVEGSKVSVTESKAKDGMLTVQPVEQKKPEEKMQPGEFPS